MKHTVHVKSSPLAGDRPTTIAYRDMGHGQPPVLFLHGGWGYEIYPIDAQAEEVAPHHRILIPDRSGHGGSSPVNSLSFDFHRQAMEEYLLFLDALGIENAIWWGHSDGAVIAALAAIERPERVTAVILEALHLYRDKPRSSAFFEQMVSEPDSFGPAVTDVLARNHGERWRDVLRAGGRAWLDLAATAKDIHHDLFEGRLAAIEVPAMLIHGARDPRTEPGEFDALCASLPRAQVEYYPTGGHSPHSQIATASAAAEAIRDFIATI